MIKIELSENERQELTNDEIEIAIARKLEIILLPILRRNINFFYAGANIPKKAEAYEKEVTIEDIEERLEKKGQTIDAVCKPLCTTIAEILNQNGIHAETVSCDTDIFRHTDVLITTSSGKQYIINYLEDMEIIQTKMKTPDFASEQYYNRRYKKFEGTVTTDGKRLDNIAFIESDRLDKIDENLGYKQFGMYMDDVIEQIRDEFGNFRDQMVTNEIIGRDLTDEEKTQIQQKWKNMSDDEILEKKLDWIFEYFNSRGNITGHTDFVMYYSRLLLARVLSSEEYKKIERFDCFVKKDKISEVSEIMDVLDIENQEDVDKFRFSIVKIANSAYVFSTKKSSYIKLSNEELKKLGEHAKISKTQRPSDLVLLLADKGNALPLVFNPLGQKFLDERAEMLGDENREQKLIELAKAIKCTDGRIQDGERTSILIPYEDGSERLIYIDENNEFAEEYKGIKKIYHYNEEKEEFTVETVTDQFKTGKTDEDKEER